MSERFYCACTSYGEDEPGMVVCWRCEQAVVTLDGDTIDGALADNLLVLLAIYRRRLEKIADAVKRSEVQAIHPFGTGHTLMFKRDDWFDVQAAKDTLDSPLQSPRTDQTNTEAPDGRC